VIKAHGSLRLCIDHRGHNEVTRKEAYPLPRADDTLDELMDASFYTHIDLANGLWEVQVRKEDIFKYNVLHTLRPNGVGRRAVQIMQRSKYGLVDDE
jgi:hypothetical protein